MLTLKRGNDLKQEDLERVIHPTTARHCCRTMSLGEGLLHWAKYLSDRRMRMMGDATEALSRGELVLLASKRHGATFSGLYDRNGDLKDDLPSRLKKYVGAAGAASPVKTQAEEERAEQARVVEARKQVEEKECYFRDFVISNPEVAGQSRTFIMQVDGFNSREFYEGGGVVLQVISQNHAVREKSEVSVSFVAECRNGKDCAPIEIKHLPRYGQRKLMETERNSANFEFPLTKFAFKENYGKNIVPIFRKKNKKEREEESLYSFIKNRMVKFDLDDFSSVKYELQNKSCNRQQRYKAILEVFPYYKWSGEVEIEAKAQFKHVKDDGEDDSSNEDSNTKYKLYWTLSPANLTVEYAKYKAAFKPISVDLNKLLPGWVKPFEKMAKWLNKLKDKAVEGFEKTELGETIASADDIPRPELTVISKCKIGGAAELVMLPDSPLVGRKGSRSLDCSDLCNVTAKFDLLPGLLGLMGGVGLLKWIAQLFKETLRKGVTFGDVFRLAAGIAIDFELNVTVGGKLEWSSIDSSKYMTKKGQSKKTEKVNTEGVSGEVKGGLTARLNGKAFVKGDVFIVKTDIDDPKVDGDLTFEAGAEANFSGANKVEEGIGFTGSVVGGWNKDGDSCLGGGIELTGLAIYYCIYIRTAKSDEESEENNEDDPMGLGKNMANKIASALPNIDFKRPGKITVLKASKWEPKADGLLV